MLNVTIDDGTGQAYDAELAMMQSARVSTTGRIVTKAKGTVKGNPLIMIVVGKENLVVTAREFMDAAYMILGKYPDSTKRDFPVEPVGHEIKGSHRGVNWKAVHLQNMYLISSDGTPSFSIGGSEEHVQGLAEAQIDRTLSGQ